MKKPSPGVNLFPEQMSKPPPFFFQSDYLEMNLSSYREMAS